MNFGGSNLIHKLHQLSGKQGPNRWIIPIDKLFQLGSHLEVAQEAQLLGQKKKQRLPFALSTARCPPHPATCSRQL